MRFNADTSWLVELEPNKTKAEKELATAYAILTQTLIDIHRGKKMIQKYKVKDHYKKHKSLSGLPEHVRNDVLNAKSAKEWVLNEPLEGRTGWTFDACCEIFGLDPEAIRAKIFYRETYEKFGKVKNHTRNAKYNHLNNQTLKGVALERHRKSRSST